jgi:hypothetical protein
LDRQDLGVLWTPDLAVVVESHERHPKVIDVRKEDSATHDVQALGRTTTPVTAMSREWMRCAEKQTGRRILTKH